MENKFINEKCRKCNESIPKTESKLEPNFWICPECNNKNYKHIMKAKHWSGEECRKNIWRESSICTSFNKSIIEKKKDEVFHLVINREGKEIHKKHKK